MLRDRPANTRVLAAGAVLVLVTLAVYWQVRSFGFLIYDDADYITENAIVRDGSGLEQVGWALTTGHAGNWHPLTWLSHILDCRIFGLDPGAHHVVNLLFHLASTVLLLVVLERATGDFWPSAFVAALFALHPLHVESVAWIAERKDVLSTLFWMLTLGSYVLYTERPSIPRLAASAAIFGLGLTAKPMLVTLPFVLLLFDFWPLRRLSLGSVGAGRGALHLPRSNAPPSRSYPDTTHSGTGQASPMRRSRSMSPSKRNARDVRSKEGRGGEWRDGAAGGVGGEPEPPGIPGVARGGREGATNGPGFVGPAALLLEKIPFFALAIASCAVTLAVHARTGAMSSTRTLPLIARAANAIVSYAGYLGKMILPRSLAVLYPHPGMPTAGRILASALVLAGVSALVVVAARRHPYLATGWLWYLGTLVPVIGLVQVGTQSMADRYTYVPLIGVFIMIAWGVPAILPRGRYRPVLLGAGAAALVAACAACTWSQLGYWKDDETLFRRALEVTDRNFVAHGNLATVLARQGRTEEAIRHFSESLRIHAGDAEVHNNLGVELARLGRLDEAISHYSEAVRIEPGLAAAYCNLGNPLFKKGDLQGAIVRYEAALGIRPDLAEAHHNLGSALLRLGRAEEAAGRFSEALRIDPAYASAHRNLGLVLAGQGKLGEAASHLAEAVRLEPGDAAAHNGLGLVLAREGRGREAVEQYAQALRLDPGYAGAMNNLALVRAADPDAGLRSGQEAVRLAERACELTGRSRADFVETLAMAYAEAGRFDEALAAARAALGLATASGEKALASALESEMLLYRKGQPYRSPSRPPSVPGGKGTSVP